MRRGVDHTRLINFVKVNEKIVGVIIKDSIKSFSENDPFPSSDVFKSQNLTDILVLYINIINLSLSTGEFSVSKKN